jgi:hypothetical protein
MILICAAATCEKRNATIAWDWRGKPVQLIPLWRWYSPIRQDSTTTADSEFIPCKDPRSSRELPTPDYILSRLEGFVFEVPLPGCVALSTFFSPDRLDFVTVASDSDSSDGDGPVAGLGLGETRLGASMYFVRREGYAFANRSAADAAGVAAVPLYSWFSQTRQDQLSSSAREWSAQRVGQQRDSPGGYVFQRVLAYLPQPHPQRGN